LTDVVVLGSGVAGLTAALALDRAGLSVTLLTKAELVASATRYAQGGVAAALSPPDSPELHFSDTVSAGGGLCDPEAVRVLVGEGPARLRELIALGAAFDRAGGSNGDRDGPFALAREGGHSLARVLHAGGDATGFEVERALVAAVVGSGVEAREGWLATALSVTSGCVTGVAAVDPDGRPAEVAARHVVLASGGAGQLFAVTTNPALSTGDGVAMALRAGAAVADLEFMQFHPTALAHPGMPRPLLSEALRGEGALLRDDRGVAFMTGDHPLGDLAPRDVVARAITRRLVERGLEHLWLDATGIEGFATRFPTISRACQAVGLDPTREWLPVAPAAHYLCGGVMTDLDGAASLPGLWACGEVACTGVHGANRLASNSLLEGLVFGKRVACAIAAGRPGPEPSGTLRGVPLDQVPTRPSPPRHEGGEERQIDAAGLRSRLQQVMTANVGVLRDAGGLGRAAGELRTLDAEASAADARGLDAAGLRALHEVWNLATVGRAVAAAAADREESRGAHHRLDHPERAREVERVVHLGGFGDRIRVAATLARELER
jgi:L-aspartate oxidase